MRSPVLFTHTQQEKSNPKCETKKTAQKVRTAFQSRWGGPSKQLGTRLALRTLFAVVAHIMLRRHRAHYTTWGVYMWLCCPALGWRRTRTRLLERRGSSLGEDSNTQKKTRTSAGKAKKEPPKSGERSIARTEKHGIT